ncbi:MAG TPA: ATP-binding protein, partial [Thermoanaerobaculaceae bacterium]|nr:ATP-binding protein [Thermoanaerobaculaceae bacterium]
MGLLAMAASLVASAQLGAGTPTASDAAIGNGAASAPSGTGLVPTPESIGVKANDRRAESTLPPVDPAAPPPDILIINSYAPGYEWSDDELSGLLSVLTSRYSAIEPVIQYLDSKRFPDPVRERWLLEDLADKCRTRPPRLIVTLDNAAFDFALKYRAVLGADIPLVFGGLNRFTPEMVAGQRAITGVSEETDYRGTFQLIRSLKPDTERILVIGNQSDSSIEKRKALEQHLPEVASHYQFEFYENWTDDQLIQRVATLPDGTVGLILDVTVDAAGHYNYNDEAFSTALASLARVPVFITARPPGDNDWASRDWDGIGGGLVVASRHGEIVGELAARVLAGEPADSIPVVRYTPQSLEVDYRHMRRFGLSTDQLPPGTKILNAPVSFYQINRSRLVAAGAIFGLLCVVIVVLSVNIYQRRRAERALRRAEAQLRSSQKMEAIGLLAGGVAHDFNNILQVIRGHAGFLQESPVASPQDREDIDAIQAAAQRAAQLTRQLLAFSRKQALNMEPLEVNALVADLAKMLRRVLGEHIDLQVLLLPEPVTLLADKGQIEQVLLNLCLNARDAMPGGGRIVLSLERTVLAAGDCARSADLKPGPHLVIKVSDTGCGMPRAVLDRLFEPFFTTKPPGKGTGLGLSVVYGIIHQHGGAISVYSEVGSGTVFRILLPLVSTELQPASDPAKAGFPVGHGTLLLAEDDPAVRTLAVRELGRNGFHVLTAGDGEEAEAVLARHHQEIRLAVLDVLMPKRSGRQVHDYLKAHHPGIRVLFCSGYTAEMLPPGTAPDPG